MAPSRSSIPTGASLSAIAAALEAKGVVKHARAFVIKAEGDGYATEFKPGTYTLHQNEPYDRLVALLSKGVNAPTVKVSIPEGTTLKQASVRVAAAVPTISAAGYVDVARDEPPPFELQGYKPGTTLEGMLFPATYEVLPKTTAARVRRRAAHGLRRQLLRGRPRARAARPTSRPTTSSSSPP